MTLPVQTTIDNSALTYLAFGFTSAAVTVGPISLSNFSTEAGFTANYSMSLSWIKANSKTGQGSNSLSGYYGHAYFKRSIDGNCNNGNCTSNCNCGDTQCTNCLIVGPVNCANCDSIALYQVNCNCACTYNCTTTSVTYNCANCNCASACFALGTLILMADGSSRRIETIQLGDLVETATGPSRVIRTKMVHLGSGRSVIDLDGLRLSDDHEIWAIGEGDQAGWAVYNLSAWRREGRAAPDPIELIPGRGCVAAHVTGWRPVTPRAVPEMGPDTALFHIETESGTYIAGGFVVSAKIERPVAKLPKRWAGLREGADAV